MTWTIADLPDLHGTVAVVTGATSGLGEQTATALAGAGAHVVLAARNATKAAATATSIRDVHPDAELEHLELDLANLASVRDAAKLLADRHDRVDILVNNAGVMAPPLRRTVDGFEMQLGTNHLGHFAFTGMVLPQILASDGRVVTVSSLMHRIGRIDFADLNSEERYHPWLRYGQSKLANLMFALELDRRFESAGRDAISVAAHPGYASTHLQTTGPTMGGGLRERLGKSVYRVANRVFAQDATAGALPQLFAATADDVEGGEYFGPDGFLEQQGAPGRASMSRRARDPEVAARLWQVSEELTGVRFDL